MKRVDKIGKLFVEKAEVTTNPRNLGFRNVRQRPIKQKSGGPLDSSFSSSGASFCINHVEPLAPRGDEGGDQLRRILKIGVDDHRALTASKPKAGRNRCLVAEVTREMRRPESWI